MLGKFLKQILGRKTADKEETQFSKMSREELERHMRKGSYDGFDLCDAIRPSPNLDVIPREGFRRERYIEPVSDGGKSVPVIVASASKERLFSLFLDLTRVLGEDIVLALESFHQFHTEGMSDTYYVEDLDPVVLRSRLCDFEQLIMDDGETGIAVLDDQPIEIQLDDHKLIIIYNWHFAEEEIMATLREYGIQEDPEMKFLHEAEHCHSGSPELAERFNQLLATFD